MVSPPDLGIEGLTAVELIGQGGSGRVYRARQHHFDREVAVKVVTVFDESSARRFARELRAMGRLSGISGVLEVFETGLTDAGAPYYTMPFVAGGSLQHLVDTTGGLHWERATTYLEAVARATHKAHEAGVLHRDIKPGNILLGSDDAPLIADFGIAQIVTDRAQTATVGIALTPAFSPPEIFEGRAPDRQTDVYGLGATLWAVIAGRSPFTDDADHGASLIEMLGRIVSEDVGDLRGEAPDTVCLVIERAMAKDPAERFHDAEAFADALADARTAAGTFEPRTIVVDALPAFGPAPTEVSPEHGIEEMAGEDQLTFIDHSESRSAPGVTTELVSDVGYTVVGRLDSRDAIPDRVGPYPVLELIANGRTGPLYKIYDRARSRVVALKVVRIDDDIRRTRMSRAATAWLDVSHSNLLAVHHVHPPHEGQAGYVLMDFVDGVDLGSLHSLSGRDLASIGEQIAAALEHLHDTGLVHRELIPSNVIVHPGSLHVTVLDSGIARPIAAPESPTETVVGELIAEKRYVAPEQQSGPGDARSDLYSLGVLLFEAATNTAAPPAADSESIRAALRACVDLDDRLRDTIVRLMARHPGDRFQTARDVRRTLGGLVPRGDTSVELSRIVVSLHGINTHARWQRSFADVAQREGLSTRLERWNFGHFAVWRFLTPWARHAKIDWFRSTYYAEFQDRTASTDELPTIVAHSFGTYILGNAMMRFGNIRFGKVILCGSILPRDFDWAKLIERGQVQQVRNEYGTLDIWTRAVEYFVPGTGQSGLNGFASVHPLLEQERFEYAHSDYFEAGHMTKYWLPFISKPAVPHEPTEVPAGRVRSRLPVGSYLLLVFIAIAMYAVVTRVL